VNSETLAKRIIACLDCHAGRVVKGIRFVQLCDAGDPAELAAAHSEAGADEIVLLDITATAESRNTLLSTVHRTAQQLFIPFTVGGGIRSLDDAAAVLDSGADKVAINSAAVDDPTLITKIALRYGSQAVVVAIDARRQDNRWEVYVCGGRNPTSRDARRWALEAEELGAGEIMLTSMDRDGTKAGFDCQLTRTIATRFNWLIVAIVLAIGPVIRHFFNSRHEGKGSPWWTWGVAAAGMVAVAWLSGAGPADVAPRADRVDIKAAHNAILTRCSMCHRNEPVWPGVHAPPKGVVLDDPGNIRRHAHLIEINAVRSNAMPPGNVTAMTAQERQILAAWLAAGAPSQ